MKTFMLSELKKLARIPGHLWRAPEPHKVILGFALIALEAFAFWIAIVHPECLTALENYGTWIGPLTMVTLGITFFSFAIPFWAGVVILHGQLPEEEDEEDDNPPGDSIEDNPL